MNTKRRVANRYSNVKKGEAIDLADNNFYASGWERDTARLFTFLTSKGIISSWDYEPERFNFIGHYNSNPLFYVPDFVVKYSNPVTKTQRELFSILSHIFENVKFDKTIYVEVKGQETGKDRNKWRRFRKVTGHDLEIVKRDKMKLIQTTFSPLIPNWESKVY